MADCVVQIETFTELEGFLVVRGFAFDPETKGAPALAFRDSETGTEFEAVGPVWHPRPEVAAVHSLADDNVGFRAALALRNTHGQPYDPARLQVVTGPAKPAKTLKGRSAAERAPQRAIDLVPVMNGGLPDPSYRLMDAFLGRLAELREGAVLEIGSRARSGHSRKELVADAVEYTGLDVMEGPSVDVVGDAHALSTFLPHDHYTHAFSVSVWEHLMVPWKVSIELNRVLRVGGEVMVSSHQTWPVHDSPSDYWRYSEWSWKGLFNDDTGFEILDVAMGIPGSVVAHAPLVGTVGLAYQPAYLSSTVIVRKTGPARMSWDAATDDLGATEYPA